MLPAFEAYARALATVRHHAGILAAATLIFVGAVFMISFVVGLTSTGLVLVVGPNSILLQGAQLVGQLLSGLVLTFLLLGYLRILIECARDREPSLGVLFSEGGRLVVGLITNGLGQTLIGLLALLPGAGLGGLIFYLVFASGLPPWLQALIGICAGALLVILTTPLAIWSYVSFAFLLDRDQDPLGALASGWRSLKPWPALRYGVVTIVMAMVGVVATLATCFTGGLLVLPWLALGFVHVYLDACQRLQGELIEPQPSEEPSAAVGSEGEVASAGDPEEPLELEPAAGADVERSGAEQTAVAPPGYGPAAGPPPGYGASAIGGPVRAAGGPQPNEGPKPDEDETPKSSPAVVAKDAVLEVAGRAAPGWVHPLTLGVLLPLMAVGGSPVTGGFFGWGLARQLGFPGWLGATAGAGALVLCGIAALTIQILALRGLQGAAVDRAGVLTHRNARWGGWRLRWSEIDSFQISSEGVVLYPRGRLGRFFGRLIPARESDAHHLVERLEAAGVYRAD